MAALKKLKESEYPICDKFGIELADEDVVLFIDNSDGPQLRVGIVTNMGIWKHPYKGNLPSIQCKLMDTGEGTNEWGINPEISSTCPCSKVIKLDDKLLSRVMMAKLTNQGF